MEDYHGSYCQKKQQYSISGCDLNDEVSEWAFELEDREVLQKFLYLHLIPNQLRNRLSSILSLELVDFERCVMDICDADFRKSKDAAIETKYFNKPQQGQHFSFQKRN